MSELTSKELLKEVRKLIDERGEDGSDTQISDGELAEKYALEAILHNKNVLQEMYYDFAPASGGVARKAKNKVIRKFANIARNTMELTVIRQQKFNDSVYFVLKYLLEENKKLRNELKNGKAK
jgi:hypothetical protein